MDVKYEHRLTELEAHDREHERRINEMEKRQDDLEDLTSTVKELATREKRVEDDVKEIKTDVKNMASKPAKRWEALVSQIITIVVAAIAGFVLAKIGM